MNPLLERQEIPCIANCDAGYVLEDDGYGETESVKCSTCRGTGYVFESHESYEARLVRMIEILAKDIPFLRPEIMTKNDIDLRIEKAFNTVKEKKNG